MIGSKKLRTVALVAAALFAQQSGMAQQNKLSGDSVKIGVLTDFSGVYSDYGGQGALVAARMAVQDFGGKMFGKPIEVVSADHQNKPDIAKSIGLRWFDREDVDISVENLADSSTRCNKDEPGDGWLRMSRHHGHSNRQVQVARCTSTSAEKNDTKFTAS